MTDARRPGSAAQSRSALAVGLLAALFVGCGGESYTPVSGSLTSSAGEPIEGVSIVFQPIGRPQELGSRGKTDAAGQFTLLAIADDRPGAVPGDHRVIMTTADPTQVGDERTPLPRDYAPLRFRDGSVTFKVPPDGSGAANFVW